MNKNVAFVLFLCVNYIKTDEDIVDYYQNLIHEEMQRSSQYQFPKDASAYRPTNTEPIDYGSYDFIIIGGGSAGSVVASRLSENKNWKVLLLEAGMEENNFTDIPAMSIYSSNSEYNWGFNTTPQSTCCLASGGICAYPRGRALGGTSVINSLVYSRGSRYDYNNWGNQGNEGWFYKDVLEYFIKSENSKVNGDLGYHGTGGYLNVEYYSNPSRKVSVFLKANENIGQPILDANGRSQLGADRNKFNTVNGRRLSAAKAFLEPAYNRTNLKILTESYVTKILIQHFSKAVGVVFSHKNTQYIAKAHKEIILSAGVINSPQILMLSGIGPANHLRDLQIPLIKDLKVGRNFHDHLSFYNTYFLSSKPDYSYKLRDAIKLYLNGTGPLTISTNTQATSFFNLQEVNKNLSDLQILLIPSINFKGFDTYEKNPTQIKENFIFQTSITLLHPKTRGRVYLKSNDPYDFPIINARCLADSHNEDMANVLKGIEKVIELVNTGSFAKLNPKLIPYDACMNRGFLTRSYWMCVISQTSMNAYHGGGTCRMGPNSSKGAVVDNKLKVYGIDNLRVADASIIPAPISGHTNAIAIMIGERAANFIKETYT